MNNSRLALYSNRTARSLSPYEIYQLFIPSKIYIERYMTFPWLIIGLIGNLLSLIVWTDRRLRRENSSAIYLAALSINDFFVLIFVALMDSQNSWNITMIRYSWCGIIFFLGSSVPIFSPVLVLAFTIERWIAICYPFKRHTLCSPKRALIVSSLLFIFVLCYNFILAFLWVYEPIKDLCEFKPIFGNFTFERQYTVASEAIFSLLVPILILLFNILVIKEMFRITKNNPNFDMPNASSSNTNFSSRKSNSKHHIDRSFLFTTIMLLIVSFYLFFTTLPVGILYALQLLLDLPDANILATDVPEDPQWQFYLRTIVAKSIVDKICISHYALNIFIYICTGQSFRQTLVHKLSYIYHKVCCKETDRLPLGNTTICDTQNPRNHPVNHTEEALLQPDACSPSTTNNTMKDGNNNNYPLTRRNRSKDLKLST